MRVSCYLHHATHVVELGVTGTVSGTAPFMVRLFVMMTDKIKTTKHKHQTTVRRPTKVSVNKSGEQSVHQEQSLAD